MKMELICRNHDTGKELSIMITAEDPKEQVEQDVHCELELAARTIQGDPLSLGDYQRDCFGVSEMFLKHFVSFAQQGKK